MDGIAYRTADGRRTVMFAASRTVASPALARSACPAVHAQALALLRHARDVELTIEADGRPVTVATGTPEGISSRAAGKEVRVTLRPHDATRITGALTYPRHAELTFDLPVWTPRIPQVTQAELIDGFDGPRGAAVPSEQAMRSAYDAIRTAAADRNLAAWLRTQDSIAIRPYERFSLALDGRTPSADERTSAPSLDDAVHRVHDRTFRTLTIRPRGIRRPAS